MAGITSTSDVDCAYHLGTNEKKDYTRDFTPELSDSTGAVVDTISSCEWHIEPDDGTLTIETPFISSPIVGCFLSNPEKGKYYRVTAHATTSIGRQIEAVIGIAGIQKSDAHLP